MDGICGSVSIVFAKYYHAAVCSSSPASTSTAKTTVRTIPCHLSSLLQIRRPPSGPTLVERVPYRSTPSTQRVRASHLAPPTQLQRSLGMSLPPLSSPGSNRSLGMSRSPASLMHAAAHALHLAFQAQRNIKRPAVALAVRVQVDVALDSTGNTPSSSESGVVITGHDRPILPRPDRAPPSIRWTLPVRGRSAPTCPRTTANHNITFRLPFASASPARGDSPATASANDVLSVKGYLDDAHKGCSDPSLIY